MLKPPDYTPSRFYANVQAFAKHLPLARAIGLGLVCGGLLLTAVQLGFVLINPASPSRPGWYFGPVPLVLGAFIAAVTYLLPRMAASHEQRRLQVYRTFVEILLFTAGPEIYVLDSIQRLDEDNLLISVYPLHGGPDDNLAPEVLIVRASSVGWMPGGADEELLAVFPKAGFKVDDAGAVRMEYGDSAIFKLPSNDFEFQHWIQFVRHLA